MADNDDKLEDLSSSSEDCIDEVQSIGEDWNDQGSRSPGTTTHIHTSKKEGDYLTTHREDPETAKIVLERFWTDLCIFFTKLICFHV